MKQVKFTLIELMVVVAIIGIIASMILPALGRSRAKSRTSVCISSSSQISKAITIQLDDTDGYYVSAYNGDDYGSMAYDAIPYYNSGTLNTENFGYYQVPLVKDYGLSTDSFFCPDSTKTNKDYQFRDDYAFNTYLHSDSSNKSRRVSVSQLDIAQESLLISEGNKKWVVDNKPVRIDVRHDSQKMVHPWADGHVTALKYTSYYNNKQWLTLASTQSSFGASFTIN